MVTSGPAHRSRRAKPAAPGAASAVSPEVVTPVPGRPVALAGLAGALRAGPTEPAADAPLDVVSALRRQAGPVRTAGAGGTEIRRWFGSKWFSKGKKKATETGVGKNAPKDAPKDPVADVGKDASKNPVADVANDPAAEVIADTEPEKASPKSAKESFSEAVQGAAPKSKAVASKRMAELRTMLKAMTPADRESISTDKAVMAQARTFVGTFEYMSLVTAVGMAAKTPAAPGAKAADKPGHLSGAQADTFIQSEMGKIAHLKGYLDTAIGAGKKADGFVAVVGAEDWKTIYEQQYKGEKVGTDDLDTNAFIANTHPDRPAIIHEDRGTPSTAIHESMHRYSELAVLNSFGSPLNEGMTEYFTRLITDRDGKPLNGKASNRTNYQSNWTFLDKTLVPLLGNDLVSAQTTLAEIYFSGKVDLIKTRFLDKCTEAKLDKDKAELLWKEFAAALDSGAWAEAKKHLPPAAAPVEAHVDAPAVVGVGAPTP